MVCGAPEGVDARVLGALHEEDSRRDLLVVLRDAERARRVVDALAFFVPELEPLEFPAWDCLPYDRVSPHVAVAAARACVLSRLAAPREAAGGRGAVLLTTAGALLQRVPPREVVAPMRRCLVAGTRVETDELQRFLLRAGYRRAASVMEPGDYAVRGGIVDLYPAGAGEPSRIELYGDEIEQIRALDPLSQRSGSARDTLQLGPASEVLLNEYTIARFGAGWRELFGIQERDDPVYAETTAGRRSAGVEHWLPLFYDRLEPLTAYLRDALIVLDHRIDEARDVRLETVRDHYRHRCGQRAPAPTDEDDESAVHAYRAVPPERLYLTESGWDSLFHDGPVVELSPFAHPPSGDAAVVEADGRQGHDFSGERQRGDVNLFDEVARHIERHREQGRRVVVAGLTDTSRRRLLALAAEHGVADAAPVGNWRDVERLPRASVGAAVLAVERGFSSADLVLITERDILGDRITRRPARRARRDAARFLAEASDLAEGDIVVHAEHGIGRFEGLATLTLGGAPHDCLRLVYDGGDKLFVPVENLDVLSRHGGAGATVALDRLGGASWQARRARLKERIAEIAAGLLKTAAERKLVAAPVMLRPPGLYAEFCARFPYDETDDQSQAIEDVLDDLGSGHAMDRLVCGDVGFGKTEVALRAAFVAVMTGHQVAVVVPTTLLARQHHATFVERFADLPVRIAQLSRFAGAKAARQARQGLKDGGVDIVIGTHALLGREVEPRRLGLLIVDEEQHFGVSHKEKLKRLKADMHVLTLTATPIPRTLQMSLAGVKDLSLMATPPIDRLAVRTYVSPFDAVGVREAIRREKLRGGQTYCVCPRIGDLDRVRKRLGALVPDASMAVAHGRMRAGDLERVMGAFYDGEIDVLVSTTIIESGLDIPNVNTLIVYRSDMFGLAQLYQLRGRIGRSKSRAFAHLTLPAGRKLAPAALRRLQVLSRLDSLGAGFSLASHDLDIRGAGNLLGPEQSGHIREVGLELYQRMLDEAVTALRAEREGVDVPARADWTPEIGVGTAVLIPDRYVRDLDLRLGLYRRLAALEDAEAVEAFRAELEDRFGAPPVEVANLLRIVAIKILCRSAGIAKLDAGPGGAVVTFHGDGFANPAGLVGWLDARAGTARLRPDMRLVTVGAWDDVDSRLEGVHDLASSLAAVAQRRDGAGRSGGGGAVGELDRAPQRPG